MSMTNMHGMVRNDFKQSTIRTLSIMLFLVRAIDIVENTHRFQNPKKNNTFAHMINMLDKANLQDIISIFEEVTNESYINKIQSLSHHFQSESSFFIQAIKHIRSTQELLQKLKKAAYAHSKSNTHQSSSQKQRNY